MHRRSRRMALVAALLGLGVTATPAAHARTAPETPVAVPAGGSLTLSGHGYGHGRGLSQYGAEGAARQGRSAAQILSFYYPGTALGAAGGPVRVLITADTDPDTVVSARSGLVARATATPRKKRWVLDRLRPGAAYWRIVPLRSGRWALASRPEGGAWSRVLVFGGGLEFWAGGAPITLHRPGGSAPYRGMLRNAGRTVNVLNLESYLRGVVPREVPSTWSPATLQAQAVAARTYAAYERVHSPAGRAWQTCDTTSCQVYGGYGAERETTNAAIDATRGQVVTYGGQPALTQFSSSNGGWTVNGSVPYLPAQPDPYDPWAGNPVRNWTKVVTAAQIQAAWPAVGTLTSLQVRERDGNGEWGGRVLSIRLTGTGGSVDVAGTDFRTKLGLRSQWFAFA